MKKIVIIAYYFLPSQASGVFRTLAFVRYLTRAGWNVTVLTVQPCGEGMHNNIEFSTILPDSVTVVRARERDLFFFWNRLKRAGKRNSADRRSASPLGQPVNEKSGILYHIKEQLTGILKTPDSQTGWFFPALLKGCFLDRPDIIYCSAPPFTGHVLGACLKKKWKVPLVIDYRDPWGGNPFRISYGGFTEKWDQHLEQWVTRTSDHIIVNTKRMSDLFANRFPKSLSKLSVITNGFDPKKFRNIHPLRDLPADKLLFVHPGVLYGQRNPLPFLHAIRIAVHKKNMTDICVQFIGQYEFFEGKSLHEHIKEMDLSEHVFLYPPMEHDQVLSIMQGADILLLLASGTTLQVPAKLFEYMGIGKPVFAICEKNSAASDIMQDLGPPHYTMPNRERSILNALDQLHRIWHSDRTGMTTVNTQPLQKYFRQSLAQMLTTQLNRLVQKPKGLS